MAPLNPLTVGVVASIKCETRFRAFFEGALQANAAAPTPVYKDGLGYDVSASGALQTAMGFFSNPGPNKVGLIVTVGGNVAFSAANAYANANPGICRPFLSLVGAVPPLPLPAPPPPVSALSWGGVSLESFGNNQKRVEFLIANGFNSLQSISLYYNSNSAMSVNEVADWARIAALHPNEVNPTPVNAMLGGPNNSSDYVTSVAQIDNGAVIVSADPYFLTTRAILIQQLNALFVAQNLGNPPAIPGNYVVYPLYNYADVKGTPPTPQHATLLGPRVEDAITVLGMLAAVALNSGASPAPFLKQPLGPPTVL
jgi:hypothetical protein